MRRGNLLGGLPPRQAEEQVDRLIDGATVRIERIVSTGQASPPGFWYDQPSSEWVVVLAGSAGLLIEGEPKGPASQRLSSALATPAPSH